MDNQQEAMPRGPRRSAEWTCQECGSLQIEQQIELWHTISTPITKDSLWDAMQRAEGIDRYWCVPCKALVSISEEPIQDEEEARKGKEDYQRGTLS
tara:strand:+ start:549 stop:836 length:288 start_codon:yes stop_codon:yes gene_type:complete